MSRYAHMDHGGWVERHTKRPISPLGKKAAYILGIACGGIYNAKISFDKSDFVDPRCVEVTMFVDDWATDDFNELAIITFLSCELKVRTAIRPVAPRYVRMIFLDSSKDGETSFNAHPSIDQAVKRFRNWFDGRARELAGGENV